MERNRIASIGPEELVLSLINDIYAAATDPQHWTVTIRRIVEAVGGSSGQLVSPTAQVLTQLWATHGFDPNVMVPYAEYYHKVDLWTHETEALRLPPCTALTGEQMVDEATFLRSEYFNDFLKPSDFQRIVACFIDDGASGARPKTSLSVYRPPGSKPFGDDAVRLLNLLSTHVRRAVQFHWRIADLEHRRATDTETLERLSVGVILLDETVQVTYMNPAAHRFVDRGDGLAVVNGQLTASLGTDAIQLSRLLGQTADATTRVQDCSSGSMAITRCNGSVPYHLTAMPVPGRDVFAVGRKHTAVIVLVSERGSSLQASIDTVAGAFGLSPAEARLLHALVEGRPLKKAAGELGIALNTAHSQLSNIFRKTDTHRQIDLLNLVGSMRNADSH